MGAVVTAAVIGAAATAYGANKSSKAAQKGANAQVTAAQIAADEARAARDQTRADSIDWMDAGKGALKGMQAYLSGDSSGFENSAQYKFAVDQGFKGLNRGLAAQGAFAPGTAADSDRIALGQGLATQYGDAYYNKLTGMSDTGAGVASGLGNLNSQTAANIGNAMLTGANAQAAGYANSANAYNNAANSIGQIAGGVAGYYARGQQPQQQTGTNWLAPQGTAPGGYSSWSAQNFPQNGNGIFMGRTA